MVKVLIPSGHWRTPNAGVPAAREETEVELAEIRKQEGSADPVGHLHVQTPMQLIRQANESLDYPEPAAYDSLGNRFEAYTTWFRHRLLSPANWIMDNEARPSAAADIACHKARNKRRAAARFRARELRRQSRASAPAPADVPALAAGMPVSPGQDATHYAIERQRDEKIMAAIHEIARN